MTRGRTLRGAGPSPGGTGLTDAIDDRRARFEAEGRAAAARTRSLAALYRACFATEAGARVLDDLRRCYGGSTTADDGRATELRSAQRDVLLRIEDMIEIAGVEAGSAAADLARSPRHVNALMNPWSDR